MKKILALCLTAVLCLCCFTACSNGANRFYNSKVLKEFQITDFPKPQGAEDFEATNSRLSFNTTAEGFEDYAEQIYTYLVEKDFEYFGYRGDELSNFFGGVPNYEFYISSEFSEHQYLVDRNGNKYENCYVFVFSDELSKDNGLLNECAIEVIYRPDDEEYNTHVCIYYDKNVFTGYTLISNNPPEHEHTGEWYMNEEIHYYEYTCGCETKDVAELHLDGDGNGLCDICSYQMVAEGNHFIRNQAGAEWLREITAEDIAEIKMISGGGGPLPPVSFTHISSSRNDAVISSIFEEYYWLDSKPVSEESTQIPDGGYFVVQFILNNGETKQLYFINGDFYHDGNGNYFEIVRLPVFRDGTNFVTRYGFERQYNPCQIHLIDETPVCEIPLSEFEFTELTDDIYLDDESPVHYFEIHSERVYFIKDCYFYIGDNRSVYYQLVGKNLDELIAEYSTTTE